MTNDQELLLTLDSEGHAGGQKKTKKGTKRGTMVEEKKERCWYWK